MSQSNLNSIFMFPDVARKYVFMIAGKMFSFHRDPLWKRKEVMRKV